MHIFIILFFRILSIMILLLFSTLLIMGKRPIGELPVFDFLAVIVLGSVVGSDIADPNTNHWLIISSILTLSLLQRIVSVISLKSLKLRKLVNFGPTIVIHNGEVVYKNLKKINYTMDEVIMLLREKDIFDISIVAFAIIEASGKISVLKKGEYEPVNLKSMNLPAPKASLPYTIILEGKFNDENIALLNISREHIIEKLKEKGYNDYKKIFYASMDYYENIVICKYNDEKI